MDWQQLRSYYDRNERYTNQYEALQQAARQPGSDVSTWFLLGYHHLMLGHHEHAAQVFGAVLKRLPEDPVSKHMLAISQQAPPRPLK